MADTLFDYSANHEIVSISRDESRFQLVVWERVAPAEISDEISEILSQDWKAGNVEQECLIASQQGIVSSRAATCTQLLLDYILRAKREGKTVCQIDLTHDFNLAQFEVMSHALSQNMKITIHID